MRIKYVTMLAPRKSPSIISTVTAKWISLFYVYSCSSSKMFRQLTNVEILYFQIRFCPQLIWLTVPTQERTTKWSAVAFFILKLNPISLSSPIRWDYSWQCHCYSEEVFESAVSRADTLVRWLGVESRRVRNYQSRRAGSCFTNH